MRYERLGRDALAGPPARWLGAVLCHDVPGPDGRAALLKGRRLERADALTLEAADLAELHLMWPEPGDVDEDTAAARLAAAVAGAGVSCGRPVESQVRLSATHRGLLRVDAAALARLNAAPDVTVFVLPDGMPVDEGRTLGGAKVTPLAVRAETLAAAEDAAAGAGPAGVVRVQGFLPLAVAAVVRERLGDRARERFETTLTAKLAWFGGRPAGIAYAGSDEGAVRSALRRSLDGADLVLAVGVASTDPLDVTWRAVVDEGARVVRRGLPVHPGSSYWIAELEGRPIIGVASCGMFSRRTALDLLLARLFSGDPLDPAFLAGLGHGGLLAAEMAFRFPPATALDGPPD